jgi:hypothetical protein
MRCEGRPPHQFEFRVLTLPTGVAIPAQKPEECDLLIAEYIIAGNLDGAVELHEPSATFVAAPGKTIIGQAAIR